MPLSSKLTKEKPWAILGITRQHYEAVKPWKAAGISKDAFAELVRLAPPEAIKALKDEADAEVLVEAMFGK
mgnify:CR=1 FL=1